MLQYPSRLQGFRRHDDKDCLELDKVRVGVPLLPLVRLLLLLLLRGVAVVAVSRRFAHFALEVLACDDLVCDSFFPSYRVAWQFSADGYVKRYFRVRIMMAPFCCSTLLRFLFALISEFSRSSKEMNKRTVSRDGAIEMTWWWNV